MDSSVDRRLRIHVRQPRRWRDDVASSAVPQQSRLSIKLTVRNRYVYITPSGEDGVVSSSHGPEVTRIERTFATSVFQDYDAAYRRLSFFLDVLSVPSCFHRPVVDRLFRLGRRAAAENVGRVWVPISASIEITNFCRISGGGAGWLEEEEDFPAEPGHGMVPANAEAVETLLKKVRVVETSSERSCSICFEDFPAGSTVAMMPCEHVFSRGVHWEVAEGESLLSSLSLCNANDYMIFRPLGDSLEINFSVF